MLKTSQAHGSLGEQLACDFLIKKNYIILERNYRIPSGELDIIAKQNREIIFVEVKTRISEQFGFPEEAVDYRKLRKMSRAMRHYLSRFRTDPLFRIDIISVTLNHAVRQAQIAHIKNIQINFEI